MEERSTWLEDRKLVLDKLEKSDEERAEFQRVLHSIDRKIGEMQQVREIRTKDLDYLLDIVRNGQNPLIERMKNLETKIFAIEEQRKEIKDHGVWIRTSIIAVIAGSIGAFWEVCKHFWLK